MLPAALLLLSLAQAASTLRVCSRSHFTVDSDAIFQRVELPSAEKCVERCVENINYCRAVVFLENRKRSLGFCIVHTVNSETNRESVHPDATLDPKSSIHELLDHCPPHSSTDIQKKISSAHRKLLEEGRTDFDESSRSDAFFPEQERFAADETRYDKKDHYAVMKSLDWGGGGGSEDPRNPFDDAPVTPKKPSGGGRNQGSSRTSSYETGTGLIPIRPQVFHLGQPVGQLSPAVGLCRPGQPCHSLDSAPCPARHGDPCAPKPPCMNSGCFHVDAPVVTAPAEWSEWGPCSATCGPAARTRTCTSGACIGPMSMICPLPPCQEWALWSPWSLCSSSCGQGERQRSRVCHGGRECDGASVVVESCLSAPCPTWAPWGQWEGCTQMCGHGRERRTRICINGLFCHGPAMEERGCDRGPCPHWSDWTAWSQCTSSCGGGEMTRRRDCLEGSTCTGASEERVNCNQQPCPSWTPWTAWTACEDKCGEESFRLRNRICLYRGGAYAGCEGPAQDQLPCPVRECAAWTEWGDWGECSATCGQGNQHRTRKCEGGYDCQGPPSELRFCQLAACPYWGEWGAWGGCSVSCGLGVCERRRKCVTDEILNIPTDLSEFDESTADFESDKAKEALIARSKHIKMMMNETEVRRAPSRTTITDAGSCDGSDAERKACDAGPCCMWDGWTDWSPCTGCGLTATIRRSRQCMAEGSQGAGAPPYLGFQEESTALQTYVAPSRIDNTFGLSPIVPTVIHRGKRHISGFQADPGMVCHCPGPAMESKPCPQAPSCDVPKPCEWSDWGEWCGCAPCRAGRENRRRFCDRGGRPDPDCRCMGSDVEERTCPMAESCFNSRHPPSIAASGDPDQYVPIASKISTVRLTRPGHHHPSKKDSAFSTTPFPYPVCRWSKWSEWSECHETHLKQRNRFCIGSDGLVNNCQCMGQSTEEIDCDPGEPERVKPDNAVPGEGGETKSEVEFSAEGEDLDQGIDSALRSTDEFSTDETANQKREEESEDEKEPPTSDSEPEKQAQECEWTRWSMWSDCTTSCGEGERLRMRRCPCGAGKCGGGIETETEACQKTTCLERRSHPVFAIPKRP